MYGRLVDEGEGRAVQPGPKSRESPGVIMILDMKSSKADRKPGSVWATYGTVGVGVGGG